MAYEPNWNSLDSRPCPQWFVNANLGVFIHWGVYSVPGWAPKGTYAEWYWSSMQDRTSATWRFHEDTYGADFRYDTGAARIPWAAVGEVVGGLQVGTRDFAMIFETLKAGLQEPLSGMGTAFSSSLFGLGGSLVLGFLDIQASHAQNRFFNDRGEDS